MEWFKHSTGSHDDPDISDAMDEFGDTGYMVFFVLLEIYGQEFNHRDSDDWLNVSQAFVARKLRKTWTKVERTLNFYQTRQRIYFKTAPGRVSIKIPKYVDIASNWVKRNNPSPTEPPTEGPTAIEEEEEKKKIKEKKRTVRVPALEKPSFVIPSWIPKDAWDGFVDMRREIKKPLTGRAINIAITKLLELRNKGHDPGQVLDQSTMAKWQGLFELKETGAMNGAYTQRPRFGAPVREETRDPEAQEIWERYHRKVPASSADGQPDDVPDFDNAGIVGGS